MSSLFRKTTKYLVLGDPEKCKQLKAQGKTVEIDCTSRSPVAWSRGLSPFYLGNVSAESDDIANIGKIPLYGGRAANIMENAWQFSKVYSDQTDADGLPSADWWEWSERGFTSAKPQRFPRGRGAKPDYAYWEEDGEPHLLKYIEARKMIYCPVYAECVEKTQSYKKLQKICEENDYNLILYDYDAYDYQQKNMTLDDVINNPAKPMGHAFVLAMLLTGDFVWFND